MLSRSVYELLSFCVHESPAKFETQEPKNIIMECSTYVSSLVSYDNLEDWTMVLLMVLTAEILLPPPESL